MRIAAGSYTNSKAISMKEWAGKNKEKIRENKRRWRARKKGKCDCHLKEMQVCDICQGVTGNEKDYR